MSRPPRARDKMRSGANLNGDNSRISRACLRIGDHCRVTVRANFSLPRPLCSRLRPDVRDRQTDRRQTRIVAQCSMPLP